MVLSTVIENKKDLCYVLAMIQASHGRIVKIRTLYIDGSGYADQIWFAAIDNDAEAIEAVKESDGTSLDEKIEVVGRLSPADIVARSLKIGDVKSV
jgi:hypothetical protein